MGLVGRLAIGNPAGASGKPAFGVGPALRRAQALRAW